eukprot:CAMPEP_0185189984 /NCGR_PEP_ID=MMETSP1140-20130426/6365_1 /TAXON_ID=298111 /ORGANISM="Pavlova sp., Strain CCMP459" /LENGTH=53 /DNA_ID=CAMNT_0027756575 /DNA_START=134 /DNA_END=292 /DNA_ORIENTATION=+
MVRTASSFEHKTVVDLASGARMERPAAQVGVIYRLCQLFKGSHRSLDPVNHLR